MARFQTFEIGEIETKMFRWAAMIGSALLLLPAAIAFSEGSELWSLTRSELAVLLQVVSNTGGQARSPSSPQAGEPAGLFLGRASARSASAASQCFGTVSNGRIEGSVQLPVRGANFVAYSSLAAATGRTHVHTAVAEVITSAYAALRKETPANTYVYGETGWPSGGRFKPHRTHQNGLSVDFFVPVRNASGKSVPLPTRVTERFGYDLEFDSNARSGPYSIDFPALAEHLYQLHLAAKARGIGIALVIFDRPYLPWLFATPRGPYLQRNLTFMKGKPWVRHDEHYHVDFAVPCKPRGN